METMKKPIIMFIQHGHKKMYGKILNNNISSFIKLPPFPPLRFLLLNVKSKDEEQTSANLNKQKAQL